MAAEETIESITGELLSEIRIVTGGRVDPKPECSLADNGINSMGFMELLVFIEQKWGVSLVDQGIAARDVADVRALARRILEGIRHA